MGWARWDPQSELAREMLAAVRARLRLVAGAGCILAGAGGGCPYDGGQSLCGVHAFNYWWMSAASSLDELRLTVDLRDVGF